MAENDPLVPLSAIQSLSDSQPTPSSLSLSSSSSSESSASPYTLIGPHYSPTHMQPTIRQRLRTIDLKVPSLDVPWELEEKEKGKIEDFLKHYSNLQELKQLDLKQMRIDVESANDIAVKKISGGSLDDGNEFVLTYSQNYKELIKSLDRMEDDGEYIKSFINEPFVCCSDVCQVDRTSAILNDFLELRGEDLDELRGINERYLLFQEAEVNLTSSCTDQNTDRQHTRAATNERPRSSTRCQCCWTFWDWCCCYCCRPKK